MSENPTKEAILDLLSHVESLQTQIGAVLQFLKDSGNVSDEQLAPYLEQADKASDVRMRAARARMEHLLTANGKAKPATEAAPAATDKRDTQEAQPGAKADRDEQKSSQQTKKSEASMSTKAAQPDEKKRKPAPQQSEQEASEISTGREAAKSSGVNKVEEKRSEPNPTPGKNAA